MNSEPIDVVYLWVDGTDPETKDNLERFRLDPTLRDRQGHCRFRDNGELRYSLRALDQHAPWIHNVFIVHGGGAPSWLDRSNARIRTVRHEEIFPDAAVLPSFNSYAIELNLHRIPGLSRKFIYLNDDFFISRDTPFAWFQPSNGLPRFFFEPNPIPLPSQARTANDMACAKTLHLPKWIGSFTGPAVVTSPSGWPSFPGIPPRCNMTAHVPQLYDRDRLMELELRYASEFRETRTHRFRTKNDIALRILYAYTGLLDNQIEAVRIDWVSPDFNFISLGDDTKRTQAILSKTELNLPRFICANDDVTSASSDHPSLVFWKAFMARNWPRPSRFERV